MSKVISCITIVICLCVFPLTAYSRYTNGENKYNTVDIPINLPPISIIDKVVIVLTPETAFTMNSKPVWTLIPGISFIQKGDLFTTFVTDTDTSDQNTDFLNLVAQTDNIDIKGDDFFLIDESLIAFAKDLADPIYNFIADDNISLDNPEQRRYFYADVSALAFSHFVRGMTNNQLDLYLLTNADNSKSLFINGLELGFRPDPFFGFRVRVWEDNNTATNSYGIELHIYPTDDLYLKIVRDDNITEQRTGLEFNMKFF